jgi:hypothetical protein
MKTEVTPHEESPGSEHSEAYLRSKENCLVKARKHVVQDSGGSIQPPKPKKRVCLQCDRNFISENIGNRLCDRCRSRN